MKDKQKQVKFKRIPLEPLYEWTSFEKQKPPLNKRVVMRREEHKKMVVARYKDHDNRPDLGKKDVWHTEHGS